MNAPGGGPTGEFPDILAKECSIPGSSFTDIEIWVQGRKLTMAGDAQYDGVWSCTFYDDEDHNLRKMFIAWMKFIDDFDGHTRSASDISSYTTEIKIQQLSTVDNSKKFECKLQNAYVKSLSEISYADENSELVTFTAEFNYSHWTS